MQRGRAAWGLGLRLGCVSGYEFTGVVFWKQALGACSEKPGSERRTRLQQPLCAVRQGAVLDRVRVE